MEKNLKVCISGSFHRHLEEIKESVNEFRSLKIQVLSPREPYIVDSIEDFLFVASDKHRSIRLVQDSHLSAIHDADFLWLVSPDGYVGSSATLELGCAITLGIPIFCTNLPRDLTQREYVLKVMNIDDAIKMVFILNLEKEKPKGIPSLLMDPKTVIIETHKRLENLERLLITPNYKKDKDIYKDISNQIKSINQVISSDISEGKMN